MSSSCGVVVVVVLGFACRMAGSRKRRLLYHWSVVVYWSWQNEQVGQLPAALGSGSAALRPDVELMTRSGLPFGHMVWVE